VNVAFRIADVADRGDVLASETTAEDADTSGFRFERVANGRSRASRTQ
jgi:class 3 adenylate cyclase